MVNPTNKSTERKQTNNINIRSALFFVQKSVYYFFFKKRLMTTMQKERTKKCQSINK